MKRILIVGRGTLGAALLGAPWVRRHSAASAVRSPESGDDLRLDITDESQVLRVFSRESWDLVVNCAAMTDVDACERGPDPARAANALGVKHLAEACERAGSALIHVSTNYVFPGTGRRPLAEDDSMGPCSIYGATKLEGEHYALGRCRRSVVVRTSWTFGGKKRDFVNHFIEKLRSPGPVPVVADQRASLTYAPDLADAMGPVAERLLSGRPVPHRVYHVANAGDCTRYEMLLAMKKALGSANRVRRVGQSEFKSWAAVRPAYTVFSTRRYKKDFGKTLRHWRSALKEYLNTKSEYRNPKQIRMTEIRKGAF